MARKNKKRRQAERWLCQGIIFCREGYSKYGQKMLADAAFYFATTEGIPIEIFEEVLLGKGIQIDMALFKKRMSIHADVSRAVGKFKI